MNKHRDGSSRNPHRFRRRTFLQGLAAGTLIPASLSAESKTTPRTPTAVRVCKRYDYALIRRTLGGMFDRIGDVRKLVKGKHVTVKTNLVNTPRQTVSGLPISLTTIAHPTVALALGSLLVEYGAKHVTFCDQLPFVEEDNEAFEKYGYKIEDFRDAMENRVRFENTRNLGRYPRYDIVKVPGGGILASAWEVNQAYTKTDVLVTLGKMKSHVSGGVTLGMKNLFGIPPSSLYGDDLENTPDENAKAYRSRTMHNCTRKPFTSIDTFLGKSVEGDHGYNVPRFIVDLNAAFPTELTVIDGISTISNAEGAWMGTLVEVCRPNLLVAGLNPVCTDAVAASAMGFDPDAPDKSQPFPNGTNYLALSRKLGLGENRIKHLDIVGDPIEKVRYHFPPTYER